MTENKTSEIKTAKTGTLWLSGRIQSSQQVGTDKENFPIIENIIITPAQDTYSHPNRYCIMSRSKFGNKDQDIHTLFRGCSEQEKFSKKTCYRGNTGQGE